MAQSVTDTQHNIAVCFLIRTADLIPSFTFDWFRLDCQSFSMNLSLSVVDGSIEAGQKGSWGTLWRHSEQLCIVNSHLLILSPTCQNTSGWGSGRFGVLFPPVISTLQQPKWIPLGSARKITRTIVYSAAKLDATWSRNGQQQVSEFITFIPVQHYQILL